MDNGNDETGRALLGSYVRSYCGQKEKKKKRSYVKNDINKIKKKDCLFDEEEPDEGRRLSSLVDWETRITTLETKEEEREKDGIGVNIFVINISSRLTWQ